MFNDEGVVCRRKDKPGGAVPKRRAQPRRHEGEQFGAPPGKELAYDPKQLRLTDFS
jgi:hypothetical protein